MDGLQRATGEPLYDMTPRGESEKGGLAVVGYLGGIVLCVAVAAVALLAALFG